MAAPPPAKRLRLTYPDPSPDSDNDQDDDELGYRPEEVIERREPEYKLTRQRIKAGNRFEQTMQSIFAKYERDFSLVGDEIDLMTGDIVVDNGHLKSLQYEGDVGIDEDEEEEGIALGDLVDEEELDSEEEERIMHGQELSPVPKHSNVLVQAGGSAMRPKPRTRPADSAIQAQYLGMSSIWTPGRDYVDDWATPVPGTRVGTMADLRRAGSTKLILDADVPENDTEANILEEEDDLLDAYQSSKLNPETSKAKPTLSRVMTMRAMRGPLEEIQTTTKPQSKAPPKSPKRKAAPKRPSPNKAPAKIPSPQPTPYNQLVVVPKQVETQPLDPNCRRSGRARRQTDFLGEKISWAEVMAGKTGSNGSFVVEISSPTLRKEEYLSVDESVDESGLPTPPDSGPEMEEEAQMNLDPRTIPDSQESVKSSPRTSQAHKRASESDEDVDVRYTTNNPSCELSDDEAPILFTKRTKPTKKTQLAEPGPSATRFQESVVEEEMQVDSPAPVVETSDIVAAERQRHLLDPEAECRVHPTSVIPTDGTTQSLEEPTVQPEGGSTVEPTLVDANKKSQPRGRGRPRKPQQEIVEESHKSHQAKALRRRPGRPRKSSLSKIDGLAQEVADSQEDVELEEPPGPAPHSGPTNRSRGEPQTHGQRTEDLPDAPPEVELPNEPSNLDANPAAHEPSSQPLTLTQIIPDSTADPTSSASIQQKATPSPTKKPPTSNSPKPSTPRHTALRTSKTPTSRRSILSLLSDDDEDSDSTSDVLFRSDDLPRLFNSPSSTRHLRQSRQKREKKTWKATPLTTEIFRTPVKRKRRRGEEKGDQVRTPGGTNRTCGVDGYRCGRDFCFNCL